MSLFTKNQAQNTQVPERQVLESKFAGSRHNILLIVVFSVINIILLITNSNTYFLFSAYIPYMLADIGMYLCGLYPSEYYGEELAGIVFLDKNFLGIMLAAAAVILILYLLSWGFSKKIRVGWMVFALVFFAVDTVWMLLMNGIATDLMIDYVFHGWVIVSLSMGISAGCKIKKLPEETVCPEPVMEAAAAEQTQPEE